MRISDWSSDVCSSDLGKLAGAAEFAKATAQVEGEDLMPPRQPGLPAPHCLARQAGPGGAAAQRQPPQHRQQGTLLHGPVVPAPGREAAGQPGAGMAARSEEHTSELQSLMPNPYARFFLKKKN